MVSTRASAVVLYYLILIVSMIQSQVGQAFGPHQIMIILKKKWTMITVWLGRKLFVQGVDAIWVIYLMMVPIQPD